MKSNLALCSCDDFCVSNKELCKLVIDEIDNTQTEINFKRLEFHDEIWGWDIFLNWLEPVIHNGKPALVLYCTRGDVL